MNIVKCENIKETTLARHLINKFYIGKVYISKFYIGNNKNKVDSIEIVCTVKAHSFS